MTDKERIAAINANHYWSGEDLSDIHTKNGTWIYRAEYMDSFGTKFKKAHLYSRYCGHRWYFV